MAPGPRDSGGVTDWLFHGLPGVVAPWLQRQRWFGGKSRPIAGVEVEDVLWFSVEPPCALVVIDVRYVSAMAGMPSRERYAIVAGAYDDSREGPTIGRVPGQQPGVRVVEAATDGPALLALLHGLLSRTPVRGTRGGELRYADAAGGARHVLASGPEHPPPVVPIGLEQSNTSVRLGSTHVFKLFRRIDDGENPQLEIGRFLGGTSFRAVPPLEGSLTYRAPDGRPSTLGILEGWVPNEGDGWGYVVARLEQAARSSANLDGLARDMRLLGTTTADFHAALASDEHSEAFAPEPITPSDMSLWRSAVLAQADRAITLVEAHHTGWPEDMAQLGRSLLRMRTEVPRRLGTLDIRPEETVQKIRIHGDYHLGQTLKTPDGFALIDFEGEPARPLADRRRKHCALKDVAGMLRSFQYAVEIAREGTGKALHPGLATSALREAFFEGYRTRALAGAARFLPSTVDALARWIGFFELEKALYEVEYELNNRPAWVHIPLGGVVRALQGNAR